MHSTKIILFGLLVSLPASFLKADGVDSKFLMTASRGEIVQAYLAQCEEKKVLHAELRRIMDRNYKLEHDHLSLKAEYLSKGIAAGAIMSAALAASIWLIKK